MLLLLLLLLFLFDVVIIDYCSYCYYYYYYYCYCLCYCYCYCYYLSILLLLGNKGTIIKRVKINDEQFITILHRLLTPSNRFYVETILNGVENCDNNVNRIVATISETLPIYRTVIRQLRINKPFEDDIINLYIELFKIRDSRICEAHVEVNNRSNYYERRRKTLFFSQKFYDLIKLEINSESYIDQIRNLISDDLLNDEGVLLKDNIEEMFIIFRDDITCIDWKILTINLQKKKCYYIDPIYNSSDKNITEINNLLCSESSYNFENIIKPFLKKHQIILDNDELEGNWVCELYPFLYYESLNNHYDNGLCAILIVYFLVNECPITYRLSDLIKFRMNFAYWLLNETLPI